jgi:NAD(P)-dependent dehydrogenase (short-subunit alcohol dehydrogenase family)
VNAINLRGVWACMKHELREMRAQGSSAIVNCSCLGGLVGLPGRAAYHASEHGVIGLTRTAALEHAPRGIRINAVCPGTIETPMVTDMIAKGELSVPDAVANQPIGRLGRADEIAAAVLRLSSPGAGLVVEENVEALLGQGICDGHGDSCRGCPGARRASGAEVSSTWVVATGWQGGRPLPPKRAGVLLSRAPAQA